MVAGPPKAPRFDGEPRNRVTISFLVVPSPFLSVCFFICETDDAFEGSGGIIGAVDRGKYRITELR